LPGSSAANTRSLLVDQALGERVAVLLASLENTDPARIATGNAQ
jgi:hypothetical protein